MVAIFEQLEVEYADGNKFEVRIPLREIVDNISSRFRKDYAAVYKNLRTP